MKDHLDLDRLIGDWLEDAPASAPGVVLPTVLAAFPSISQRRGWRVPWSIPATNGNARMALVAGTAAIAVIAVGGLLWLGGSSGTSIGGPTPSTAPRPAVDDGSGADPRSIAGLVPDVVVGHWVAERDPDGLAKGRYELILEADAASARRLDGTQPPVMLGQAGMAPWPVIEFKPTSTCDGSGRYRWLYGDGQGDSFGTLVLEPIADACEARRSLLEGWWEKMTFADVGQLDPAQASAGGRHALIVDGIPLSFEAPADEPNQRGGWTRYLDLLVSKDIRGSQGAEAVVYWTAFPDGEFADPCGLLSLPIGPSMADLATAVSLAPYSEVASGPSDVTVGGRPAKHVVLTVLGEVHCNPGYFYTWVYQPGGPGWWGTGPGDTINVWIVDVGGTRLFIAGETKADAGIELEQEVQQIVDSIRFE